MSISDGRMKQLHDEVRSVLTEMFDAAADWRDRKSSQYPDDDRNAGAREDLRCLRDSVSEIPEELISSYLNARARVDSYIVGEIESEAFRSIGFRSEWESATAFLRDLRDDLARKAGLDLQQMEAQGTA